MKIATDHVVADAGDLLRHGRNGHARILEAFEGLYRAKRAAGGGVHRHQQQGQFDDLVTLVRQAGGFGVENKHARRCGGRGIGAGTTRRWAVVEQRQRAAQYSVIWVPLQLLRHVFGREGQGAWGWIR